MYIVLEIERDLDIYIFCIDIYSYIFFAWKSRWKPTYLNPRLQVVCLVLGSLGFRLLAQAPGQENRLWWDMRRLYTCGYIYIYIYIYICLFTSDLNLYILRCTYVSFYIAMHVYIYIYIYIHIYIGRDIHIYI